MQKKPMFNDDLHDDSSYQKTYHYSHPNYNYKKLKRFAAMGVIVIIVMLIAVIVSSINKGNDANNIEIHSAALGGHFLNTKQGLDTYDFICCAGYMNL